MKKLTTLLSAALVAVIASDAAAQRRPRVYDQQDMMQRKTDLLGEAWLQNANWVMSYAEAKAAAKKSSKMIFGYFTRSYAP